MEVESERPLRSRWRLIFHRRYILPAARGQGKGGPGTWAVVRAVALALLLLSVAAWGGGARDGGPDRAATQLWTEYVRLFGVVAEPPAVLLYEGQRAYHEAARRFGTDFPQWSGGFYDCHGRVHVVRQATAAAEAALLRHELAHALLGRCSDIPVWFHEGFAGYLAAGGAVDAPAEELARRYRQTGIYLPEASFLTAGPGLVYDGTTLAVRYLVATRGEEPLRELVRRLRRGEPFEQAFRSVYAIAPAGLYAELWLGQPTAPGPAATGR